MRHPCLSVFMCGSSRSIRQHQQDLGVPHRPEISPPLLSPEVRPVSCNSHMPGNTQVPKRHTYTGPHHCLERPPWTRGSKDGLGICNRLLATSTHTGRVRTAFRNIVSLPVPVLEIWFGS